ncbi:hypothetical protein [Bacillus sp. SM2101]|uniref:hypothetical protein n=1 Tax=Bacillus sp. SM2101 TaxID=2805366 RepID=UPI001BDEBFFE|nr:hypothetical protein [Bacillus sp. SM2101]
MPRSSPTSTGGISYEGAFCLLIKWRSDLEGIGTGARHLEKRKCLGHPRQALEAFHMKALLDFVSMIEVTLR